MLSALSSSSYWSSLELKNFEKDFSTFSYFSNLVAKRCIISASKFTTLSYLNCSKLLTRSYISFLCNSSIRYILSKIWSLVSLWTSLSSNLFYKTRISLLLAFKLISWSNFRMHSLTDSLLTSKLSIFNAKFSILGKNHSLRLFICSILANPSILESSISTLHVSALFRSMSSSLVKT